mgnify:CR=1 FL=1
MEHKKIDDLFQEQLKNLEVSPNQKVWKGLETKLIKKKRRIFPFWWFSGSIASILVLGLYLYPFPEVVNQKIKTNSNEITTTIPEKKQIEQNKKDHLILNKNKADERLISKKEKDIFIDKKKNTIIEPKKIVKGILLSYHKVNENLIHNKEESTIISNKLTTQTINKKINLKDFLSKNKPSKTKKSEVKNWSVAPIFAVLKSNSFTNTSPINENLANSTKGENSYSYGVQIAYQLNERWTIQSGLHMQEMSYSNNQIGIYEPTSSSTSITEFTNGDSFSFDGNFSENLSLSSDFQSNIISPNGSLVQNFGYIEIPVEIKYNFSNDVKFKTQLVTGFSSLFLNKNEVNLNTENLSRTLKVRNLNNINFSGNLGFNFNYLFNKNWSLNLNPMLKVQLNTFNKNANNFAPFNIGIYSGVTYNF